MESRVILRSSLEASVTAGPAMIWVEKFAGCSMRNLQAATAESSVSASVY